MKKQHHQKNRRKKHLATGQLQIEPIEPRTKLDDGLRLTLDVIEHGEKRGEGIRHSVWATMLHQGGEHFKTPAVKLSTLVFEKETKSTVLDGTPKSTFPGPARLLIGGRSREDAIVRARGEFRHTEIKLNLLKRVNEGLGIFQRVNFEKLGPRKNRRSRRWR